MILGRALPPPGIPWLRLNGALPQETDYLLPQPGEPAFIRREVGEHFKPLQGCYDPSSFPPIPDDDGEALQGTFQARNEASGAEGAAGLVSCRTSHTPPTSGNLSLNPKKIRADRMRRAVMRATLLHRKHAGRAALLTLTYAADVEPNPKDISRCITAARNWAKRRGVDLRYAWTAELTKAGKLHYHICTIFPPGFKLPKLDEAGWWKHGMTNMKWARNAAAYIAKYVSKGTGGKGYPKGFRIHGSGGLNRDERDNKRYHCAPAWVRSRFTCEDRPKPMREGSGWYSPESKEICESPWHVLSARAGRVHIVLKSFLAAILTFEIEKCPQPA